MWLRITFRAALHRADCSRHSCAQRALIRNNVIANGRDGSTEPAVQACVQCHGGERTDPVAPMYPYLAGQHAGYIERQLMARSRGSDPNHELHRRSAHRRADASSCAVLRLVGSTDCALRYDRRRAQRSVARGCRRRTMSGDRAKRGQVPRAGLDERVLRKRVCL